MGMYCCCGVKIRDDFDCTCDWDGWISTCDWPSERKNTNSPIGLPKKDGKYLVRIQNTAGDRYEDEKTFSVIPKMEMGGYSYPQSPSEIHWEDESWEEGTPYAWKPMGIEL